MPFQNIQTGEFGIGIDAVRRRYPEVSLPEIGDYGDYEYYAPVVPVFDPATQYPVEIAPHAGEQQWQIMPRSIRITITRTQGLVYLFREYRVKESEVQGLIDAIEDPDKRYEADLYFKAATWDDDNEYVAMFAAAVGLVTPEIRKAAFAAAALP